MLQTTPVPFFSNISKVLKRLLIIVHYLYNMDKLNILLGSCNSFINPLNIFANYSGLAIRVERYEINIQPVPLSA